MINADKDALVCDLAETYGIYEFERLPMRKVAVFACGLRSDSRIKQHFMKQKTDDKTIMLAIIADRIGAIMSGGKAKSICESLFEKESDEEAMVFSSVEEFEKAWMS